MNTFISLLLTLFVIHVIVDFYWQPESWVEDKNSKKHKSLKLYLHAFIHGIAASLPILLIKQDWWTIASVLLSVSVTHWLIDLWKIHQHDHLRFFIYDQCLHLIVLTLLATYITDTAALMTAQLTTMPSAQTIAIILGYTVIFKPTSILISMVLKKYATPTTPHNKGLMAGGEMIGYLERMLILTFVIMGQYAVIGFILAAKSIFRFGDLNNKDNHNLTEYVLLGSLLSVTITSMVGMLIGHFI